MSTFAWPDAFPPQQARLVVLHNQATSTSPLSGYTQTSTHPGSRWGWVFDFPARLVADAAAFEGFITKLQGREHRVLIHDRKRPRPRGTCNLTGVTVGASAAQFATALTLMGCGAAKTLLAGDWIGLPNGQLLMVVDDATANGSGVMSINVRHSLRAAASSGWAVTLDKPTALYVLTESRQEFQRTPGLAMPGATLEFEEVFA